MTQPSRRCHWSSSSPTRCSRRTSPDHRIERDSAANRRSVQRIVQRTRVFGRANPLPERNHTPIKERLENRCGPYGPPRVRIPPPPLQGRPFSDLLALCSPSDRPPACALSSTTVSERLLWQRFIPPPFPPDRRRLPQPLASALGCVGRRNRRSQVRILTGALTRSHQTGSLQGLFGFLRYCESSRVTSR